MDILGIVGIPLAVAIALWQHLAGKATERRLAKQLEAVKDRFPGQVGSIVQRLSASLREGSDHLDGGIAGANVRYADVNGDGHKELLVDYPSGAHGCVLEVYGFDDMEFVHLGGLSSGTPSGFEVGDLDGDGKLEISSIETDWSSGKSYVDAPRHRVIHKWTGTGFAVVKEELLSAADDT